MRRARIIQEDEAPSLGMSEKESAKILQEARQKAEEETRRQAEAAVKAQEEARLRVEEKRQREVKEEPHVSSPFGARVGVPQAEATASLPLQGPQQPQSGQRYRSVEEPLGSAATPLSLQGQEHLGVSQGLSVAGVQETPASTLGSTRRAMDGPQGTGVSPPFAAAGPTLIQTQEQIQEAINRIHGILQNYIETSPGNYNFINNNIYGNLQQFITKAIQSPTPNQSAKENWNQIIGELQSIAPGEHISTQGARSMPVSAYQSSTLPIEEICAQLQIIKDAFVKPATAGGSKKRVIRKSKRKSTSRKTKPTRKYKKRSVSTKK